MTQAAYTKTMNTRHRGLPLSGVTCLVVQVDVLCPSAFLERTALPLDSLKRTGIMRSPRVVRPT
jgi:hypothetical protein